jgi:hypothetical protein
VSSRPSPLGFGLYFIDVLACLLLCLSLALVGARFGREVTVPVDLPGLPSGAAGSDLSGASIVLRAGDAGAELLYEGEPLEIEELEQRLAAAPPASVVVLSEASLLARVVGAAHAAGVHDIRLAYDESPGGGEPGPCCD